ncbi:MAG: TonB-dependent receptor [Candidatus Lustribacter sp.]|jgi:hypothetical protein
MNSALLRCARTAFIICYSIFVCTAGAYAADAYGFLTGTITNAGAPVAGAQVTATGNQHTVSTTADAHGHFAFPPLAIGTYSITAKSGDLIGTASVDLGGGGSNVTVAVAAQSQVIGTVVGSVPQVPTSVIQGTGSDVVLNSTALQQLPFNNSFPSMEIQMPGAVRGANGVVHMNGDHGVINYMLDGVALPQELNRDIGGEIDLNDLSFVDLIEGAYPAQYGMRFGSVFNMATRAGTGAPGFDGNFSLGSYTTLNGTLGYHAPLPGGGGFDIALSGTQTTRGLDPPNFDSPHNNAASTGQFARFTLPAGGNNFTDITFINSASSYQIPNDVANGEPADTDDSETQADTFLALQYHHAIGDTGALTFGPAYKVSRIQDFGDPNNDFAYGEALNVEAPPYGNGGSSTDCATAYTPGTVNSSFLPTTCGYSLADTRTAVDYIFQVDYNQSFGRHKVAAGVEYDTTRVLKYYGVTLQPGNFLAPVLTPATPDAPITVVDNSPNIGNTYESYLQDSWRMSDIWGIDYGMRYDFFNIASTAYDEGFGGFSPRFKLTRYWGDRASMYAYIGRFFEPFSLENVSPLASYQLNLPLLPAVAQFDLLPERDTDLELGGHIPVGAGDLGFRVWQKNANDLIDDTQVGVTLLHQDINYQLGRLSQEALNYVHPLPRNGRWYVSGAHVISLNSGCETQLLAPCFGAPTGYTPADHEERWSGAAGVLLPNTHGGWFSADAEYGSGLSTTLNPATITCAGPGYALNIGGPCKFTPHTTLNVEEGFAISPAAALTVDIQNLNNDRYMVTFLNAQGNHFAPPREFEVGVRFH